MKIAIVGAGSVGQAFGFHLQAGAAEVHFLVRERYVEELAQGLSAVPLNRGKRAHTWSPAGVCGSIDGLPRDLDQIWLCMPLTGFDPDQAAALADHAEDALLVTMMSNLAIHDQLVGRIEPERLVFGMITLAGFAQGRGQAWWFPPFAPTGFSGAQASAPVAALRAGGAPAAVVDDVVHRSATGSSVLIPLIAGMELADWSFARLATGAAGGLAGRAVAQAQAVLGAELGRGVGLAWLGRFVRLLAAGAWLLRRVPPFDLQQFFATHFTKVGAQTEVMLGDWAERGRRAGHPVEALDELVAALRAQRSV
jgi:hypothetical protein